MKHPRIYSLFFPVILFLSSIFYTFPGNAASSLSQFFLDVPTSHPYFFAITELQKDGVINGYSDETFRPDQKISRAEALKVLLAGSKIPVPETIEIPPFPDVPANEWFAPYVSEAKSKNIIRGKNGEFFDPNTTVNRAEALKMIILTREIPIREISENPYANIPVDEWFAPYFQVAAERGIFDASKTESVLPNKELNRGELVEMMYRFRLYDQQISDGRVGIASWYSGVMEEGKSEYTAAHRTLEKGTKILVTDYATGKSVVVRINDRGPYLPGRILDLSKKAFEAISDPSKGISLIEFEVVSDKTPEGPAERISEAPKSEKPISKDFWEGITLSADVYPVVRKGETLFLRGRTTAKTVFANINKKDSSFPSQVSTNVKEDGTFTLPLFFPEEGSIELGIFPKGSDTTRLATIKVFTGKEEASEINEANPAPKNFRVEIQNGESILQWDDTKNNVFHIQFRQNERIKNLYIVGVNSLTIPRIALKDFSRGAIFITIRGAESSSNSSIHLKTPFSGMDSFTTIAIEHFPVIQNEKLSFPSLPQSVDPNGTIIIKGVSSIEDEPTTATALFPDGEIKEIEFQKNGKNFSVSLPTNQIGTHVVEVSGKDGIALAILPVYSKGFIPILPDFFDLHPRKKSDKNIDEATARSEGLALVNEFRNANGLTSLKNDQKLEELAQFRAEDMRDRSYFGHVSPDGKDANDIRAGFAIKTSVSENISHDGDVYQASYGLSISATHRENLLNPNFENIGIGVVNTADGGVHLVQIFAERPFLESELGKFRTNALEIFAKRRNGKAFLSDITLDGAATAWSDIMAEKGEVKLEFDSGESYKKISEKAGFTKSTKWSAIAFSKRKQIEEFFNGNSTQVTELIDGSYAAIGIGFSLSPEGILFMTIIAEEK